MPRERALLRAQERFALDQLTLPDKQGTLLGIGCLHANRYLKNKAPLRRLKAQGLAAVRLE